MCGRYNLRTKPAELGKVLDALPEDQYRSLLERYNIAPTTTVLAARLTDGQREVVPMRWGLIPSWAKDAKIGAKLINARSDTVATKPSFRSAFKRRRCLIPASGYYEWKGTKPPKQPFHIHRPDDGLMVFAGLWEHWDPPEGDPVESCSIITTDANQTLAEVHNRMPVVLSPSDFAAWLEPDTDRERLESLLKPAPENLLDFTPISTRVNNVRNQGPELVESVA